MFKNKRYQLWGLGYKIDEDGEEVVTDYGECFDEVAATNFSLNTLIHECKHYTKEMFLRNHKMDLGETTIVEMVVEEVIDNPDGPGEVAIDTLAFNKIYLED